MPDPEMTELQRQEYWERQGGSYHPNPDENDPGPTFRDIVAKEAMVAYIARGTKTVQDAARDGVIAADLLISELQKERGRARTKRNDGEQGARADESGRALGQAAGAA